MRLLRSAPAAATAILVLAVTASAFVPRAERVAAAVAESNVASGRAQPLLLEVQLVTREGGDPVGSGELVVHPTGLARLELRGAQQLVERHLLQGSEHSASRNGRELAEPRAFLPPLFLLQSDSALTLRAALSAYDVDADAIRLAPCGERDCYVLGGLRAPPPRLHHPQDEELPPAPEVKDPRERPTPIPPDAKPALALWIDTRSYQVVGIDASDGVKIRFGPLTQFGTLRVPRWLRIEEPGRGPVRFLVERAAPVNAPAAAFGRAWLTPEPPGDDPETSGVDTGDAPGPPDPEKSDIF
ncbi:MAG: hypothetical protein MJE66_21825 [Proteobacteria bacterium]|nr:hypothetical protein [Pseudomonadota bacterium]